MKNYESFKFPSDVSHLLPYFKTNLSYYCCLFRNESSVCAGTDVSVVVGARGRNLSDAVQQMTKAQQDGRPATVFCSINFGFITNSRTSRRRKPGDSAALLSPSRPDTSYYRSVILLWNKSKLNVCLLS
jgi:hypothetical protein